MNRVEKQSNTDALFKQFRRQRLAVIAILGMLLYLLWVVLSGHYDTEHLALGVASVVLVVFLNSTLILPGANASSISQANGQLPFLGWWRFLWYIPWLLVEIAIANVNVAYLVLHPRMPIKPALLQFSTKFNRGVAQVVLANSITLTPGTVTVELREGNYVVHALLPRLAEGLVTGRMQSRVGAIFKEKVPPPATVRWLHSIKELEL